MNRWLVACFCEVDRLLSLRNKKRIYLKIKKKNVKIIIVKVSRNY